MKSNTMNNTILENNLSTQPGDDHAYDLDLAIEINDLVISYGQKRAVDGLNLKVPLGSIFGFLGPNGSGKTTTIKSLLGFRPPNGGTAKVLGLDIVKHNLEIRSRVGFVSEVNSLYDFMKIPQLCRFCAETSNRWNQEIADRYIKMFGLPTNVKVSHFSKGMKSQLSFALAMGNDPDLLILDEPTSGLDPLARHELLNKLISEVAVAGKTVFFSSHILAEVESIADWVGIINKGRLVVSSDMDTLKQSQKILKLTYEEKPTEEQIQKIRSLPNVVNTQLEGRTLRTRIRGEIEETLASINALGYALRDIDVINQTLEDIYITYMREENNVG